MAVNVSSHLAKMGVDSNEMFKMRSMDPIILSSYDFLRIPSKENYLNTIDDHEWISADKSDITYETHFADKNNTILVIDFECTHSKKDWRANLSFLAKLVKHIPKKAYKNSKTWIAHGGFRDSYHEINDILKTIITDNISTIEHIVIRGYSQGAAYAGLCCEDIEFLKKYMGYRFTVDAIGYECPRFVFFFLSWRIGRRLDNFIVIRNMGDIVTHAPFTIMGFIHKCGKFICIGKWYRELFPLHFMHYADKVYKYLPSWFDISKK